MKQIKTIIIGIAIITSLTCALYATSQNPNIFEYSDPRITVEFSEENELTYEVKETIANEFAGIVEEEAIGSVHPNNIICTLFGHSTSTTMVTVTHHRAYIHAPRCTIDYYDVTTCSRCSYNEKVLLGSEMIHCCPEDLIN